MVTATMSSYVLTSILGLLILPATIAGLLRIRSILPADKPLIVILVLGSLNEILMIILAKTIKNNIPCAVIYELFDAYFLSRIFFNWGCLYHRKAVFRFIQLGLLSVWLWEHHSFASFFVSSSIFAVLYSCVLVLMGIDCINRFIVTERHNLLRNGRFLIAMAVVVSSSYEAVQELVFWIYPEPTASFYEQFWGIMEIIMVFVNIAFLFGIVRLPKRERFTLSVR